MAEHSRITGAREAGSGSSRADVPIADGTMVDIPGGDIPGGSIPAGEDCTADVAVIGSGIIGLSVAWEAAQRGMSVIVIDPAPGRGATFAAAGMLAPSSELHYQEEQLLSLTLESARRYPGFVGALEAASGVRARYRESETLVVAVDAADRQALADLRTLQTRLGLAVEELSTRAARGREPLLGPQLTGAFLSAADHQVDPRHMAAALLAALQASGRARFAARNAVELLDEGTDRIRGVRLEDGARVAAGEVVLANALGAAKIAGLPAGLNLALRPVYGDILRLAVPGHLRPLLRATVRGLVHGVPVYLVPREDDTVVLGATSREDGSAAVSAGGVYELLRDARTIMPAVAELELLEATCRARPGTPDNAPYLGRAADGLVVATGFFRHGVLLAPAAARYSADLIEGTGRSPDPAFAPDRFGSTPIGSTPFGSTTVCGRDMITSGGAKEQDS